MFLPPIRAPAFLFLLSALLFAAPVSAATLTWDGGAGTTSWFDGANWSSNTVPTSADSAIVDTTGIIVSSTGAITTALTIANALSSTGSLTVSSGGSLRCTGTTYIGGTSPTAGGTGTMTVTDSGTVWTTGYSTLVNRGSLTVQNGATVNGQRLNISGTSDAGSVLVTGPSSLLKLTDALIIGYNGITGTVSVLDGASLTSTAIIVGQGSNATSSLTVSGENSTATVTASGAAYTNSGEIYVGYGLGNVATFNILDGASVSSTAGRIGRIYYASAISSGTVLVDGATSSWTISNALKLGEASIGNLTVSTGGTVSAGSGIFGIASTASGTATITGSDSSLSFSGDLVVGQSGQSTVTLTDNGSLSVSGTLLIAENTGSVGTVILGAASGSAAASAGTLSASTIAFGSGTGKLVFNHTNYHLSLGFDVTGPGAIIAEAGTTTLTGDLSGFTGTLSLTYPGMIVLGNTGSQTIGATLSGTGILGISAGTTILTQSLGSFTGGFSVEENATLNLAYDGTHTLTRSLAGAGTFVLSEGTLSMAGHLTGFSGTISIENGASFLFARSGTQTVSGAISGAGTLGITTGTTSLTGSLSGFTGALSLQGGVLQFAQSGTQTISSAISGTGTLGVANGTTALSGDLSGFTGAFSVESGELRFAQSGTHTVANTITGAGTIGVSTGTTALTGSLSGFTGTLSIASGGTLKLAQSGTQTISGAISGAGTLGIANGTTSLSGNLSGFSGVFALDASGTLLFAQTGAQTLANAITGAGALGVSSGTTTLTGDLSGFTGTTLMSGGELIIGSSSSSSLSAVFSGTSTLSFQTGTTTLTGDSSGFAGITDVSSSGTLVVNGSLGGTVNVLSSARLQGSGTIGTLSAANGSTVAPGNSIGTLSISGDVTFAAGSTYEVEIDVDGSSDQIVASGTAYLYGGTVNVLPYTTGNFTAGTVYTILTAGSISGTFADVTLTSSLLFLTPTLSYDSTHVYMTLVSNNASFSSAAATSNQFAVATAIEVLGSGNDLYDAMSLQTNVQKTQNALQSLSGELHADIKTSLLEDQFFLERLFSDRLAGVRSSSGTAVTTENGLTYWTQGFNLWSHHDGDVETRRFLTQSNGVVMGVESALDPSWQVGVAFSYSRATYDLDQSQTASGTSENFSLSAYGSKTFNSLSFRGGALYGFHAIDTQRPISFEGFSDDLRGSYQAHNFGGFAEAAYEILFANALSLEPFARTSLAFAHVPSFDEEGGTAALIAQDSLASLATTTVGLRGRQTFFFEEDSKSLALSGLLGWQRAIGNRSPETKFSFKQSPAFQGEPAALPQDSLLAGAGLSFSANDALSLHLDCAISYADQSQNQSVRGGLLYRF